MRFRCGHKHHEGRLAVHWQRFLKLSVSYDLCARVPISRLLTTVSRGLLRNCENFTNGLFAALLATQQLPTDAIVIRSSLSPSFNHAGRELILNNKSIKILPLSSLNVLNVIPNPQKSGKMNRHIYLEYLEVTSHTVDLELDFI